MKRVEEFIRHMISNCPKDFEERIAGKKGFLKKEKSIEDIINEFGDSTEAYITEYAQPTSLHIEQGGGDEWSYEGGVWSVQLYEINGWYYWREPEGETHGLYTSKEDALEDYYRLY